MENAKGDCKLKEQKVSVAIATYNGEKYIEEQLRSILEQTVPVCEIVISDDGSSDRTLDIVRSLAECPKADKIEFVLIQDNPRQGPGGNCEWALSHCTGDYIFICGQDDIWLPNKVEAVLSAFENHPDALCVLHNARLIDSDGNSLQKKFMDHPGGQALMEYCREHKDIIIPLSLLETSFEYTLVSGVAVVIKKELLEGLFPIPARMEDQWIEFKAVSEGRCVFLNEELTLYRRHSENVSGSKTKGRKRISHFFKYLNTAGNRHAVYFYPYEFSGLCLEQMERMNLNGEKAYQAALSMNKMGVQKKEAYDQGGIPAVLKLIGLYHNNLLYKRSSGPWGLFFDILFVIRQ